MFETAEIGNKIDKERYKKDAPKVREQLLEVQKKLAASDKALVVIVGGVEGAGKSESANLLLEWMDARGIQVHAMWHPSDEERERPFMWRFWRALPPRGRLGIFLGSWYTQPIIDHVFKKMKYVDFDESMDQIVEFERMLTQEGVVIAKFWMHLSKKAQRKRLEELSDDPQQRWRVRKMDLKYFKKYDRFREVSEDAIGRTNTAEAPWTIIEAEDWRYRSLTLTQSLIKTLEERLAQPAAKPPRKPDLSKPKPKNILRSLDMTRSLTDDEYGDEIEKQQRKLNLLSRRLHDEGRSMTLVFEGADAAGKGGTIRRVVSAIDARDFQVIAIAAPTDEERAHPYLWRFWRHLPRQGKVTIYDRSWYGRVLVERVEGFCAEGDWKRAYAEINGFEKQLTDAGTIVRKFWLTITPEEQLKRFKDRQTTPYKQYKITEEDWRNRAKWDAYEAAACDMIEKTSTPHAPWTLVEANDKNWARIKVIKAITKALEEALK